MFMQRLAAPEAKVAPPDDLEAKKAILTTVVKDACVHKPTILGNKVLVCCVSDIKEFEKDRSWSIQIFDVNTLEHLSVIPMRRLDRRCGFTTDDKLICAHDDGKMRVWDVLTTPRIPILIAESSYNFCFDRFEYIIGIGTTSFITINISGNIAIWQMTSSQSGMQLNDPTFIGERIPRKYLYAGEADKNIFLPGQNSILCVGHNGIALFNLRTYRITSFVDIDDIINVFCSPDQSVVSVHHGMDNKHWISHFRADTLSRIENPTNLSAKFYNPSCVISLGEDWVAAKDITNYVQIRNISNPDDSKPAQLTKLPWSADKLQYSVGNMVDCCEMKIDDQNKLWVATNEGLACITVNSLELLFDVIADKLSTFSIDLIKTIYLYALIPNFSWPQPVNRLATRYIKSRMRDTDEKKSAGPTSSIDEKASMELISSVLKIFNEQFAALNQQSFLQRFTYIRNLPNASITELATKVKGNLDLFATTLFAENEAMKSQPQAPFAKALNATIYKMKQQSAFVMKLTQLEEKDRGKIINPHLFDLAVNLLTWGAKQEVKFYCDTVSIAEIRNVAHELVKHSLKKCDSSYDKTKAELLKMMQDSKSKIKDVVLLRELDFTCSSIDAGAGIIARIQIG